MGYWDGAVQGARVGQQIGDNLTTGALQDQALQQANSANAIKLAQQDQAQQDTQANRAAMANAQPSVAPAAIPAAAQLMSNAPVAPVSSAAQLMGAPQAQPVGPPAPTPQQTALQGIIDASKAQTYDSTKSIGDNDVLPGTTNLAQGATDAQNAQIADLQAQEVAAGAQPTASPAAQADGSPAPAAPPAQAPAPQPAVGTGDGGQVTPTDRMKAAMDAAYARGDSASAEAIKQQIFANAKSVVDATGNPAEGLKIINAAMGTNFSYMKMGNIEAIKDGNGDITGFVDFAHANMDAANGMSMTDAINKNYSPSMLGPGQSQKILTYLGDNPVKTNEDQMKFIQWAGQQGITGKSIIPFIDAQNKLIVDNSANIRAENQITAADNRQASSQAHSDAAQQRGFAQQSALIEQRLANQQGDPASITNAATMAANGQLSVRTDLSRISGHDRLAIIAQAKQINPNFDPNLSAAQNASLTSLVKTRGAISANEIDANKNFDQLVALHAKLGNGLIPAVNEAVNYMKDGMGAPDPGTAAGVAYEALTQYARVINKATGGASVTDSARKEANNLLPILKLNNAQVAQRVAQYRITMDNTIKSQDQAINQVRGGAPIAPSGGGTTFQSGKYSVTVH